LGGIKKGPPFETPIRLRKPECSSEGHRPSGQGIKGMNQGREKKKLERGRMVIVREENGTGKSRSKTLSPSKMWWIGESTVASLTKI